MKGCKGYSWGFREQHDGAHVKGRTTDVSFCRRRMQTSLSHGQGWGGGGGGQTAGRPMESAFADGLRMAQA